VGVGFGAGRAPYALAFGQLDAACEALSGREWRDGQDGYRLVLGGEACASSVADVGVVTGAATFALASFRPAAGARVGEAFGVEPSAPARVAAGFAAGVA
jgi:hypothetical protein